MPRLQVWVGGLGIGAALAYVGQQTYDWIQVSAKENDNAVTADKLRLAQLFSQLALVEREYPRDNAAKMKLHSKLQKLKSDLWAATLKRELHLTESSQYVDRMVTLQNIRCTHLTFGAGDTKQGGQVTSRQRFKATVAFCLFHLWSVWFHLLQNVFVWDLRSFQKKNNFRRSTGTTQVESSDESSSKGSPGWRALFSPQASASWILRTLLDVNIEYTDEEETFRRQLVRDEFALIKEGKKRQGWEPDAPQAPLLSEGGNNNNNSQADLPLEQQLARLREERRRKEDAQAARDLGLGLEEDSSQQAVDKTSPPPPPLSETQLNELTIASGQNPDSTYSLTSQRLIYLAPTPRHWVEELATVAAVPNGSRVHFNTPKEVLQSKQLDTESRKKVVNEDPASFAELTAVERKQLMQQKEQAASIEVLQRSETTAWSFGFPIHVHLPPDTKVLRWGTKLRERLGFGTTTRGGENGGSSSVEDYDQRSSSGMTGAEESLEAGWRAMKVHEAQGTDDCFMYRPILVRGLERVLHFPEPKGYTELRRIMKDEELKELKQSVSVLERSRRKRERDPETGAFTRTYKRESIGDRQQRMEESSFSWRLHNSYPIWERCHAFGSVDPSPPLLPRWFSSSDSKKKQRSLSGGGGEGDDAGDDGSLRLTENSVVGRLFSPRAEASYFARVWEWYDRNTRVYGGDRTPLNEETRESTERMLADREYSGTHGATHENLAKLHTGMWDSPVLEVKALVRCEASEVSAQVVEGWEKWYSMTVEALAGSTVQV